MLFRYALSYGLDWSHLQTVGIVPEADQRPELTTRLTQAAVFIADDAPICEDRVRQTLIADAWANVSIKREGRYFQVIGAKDQQVSRLTIDSQTGRF